VNVVEKTRGPIHKCAMFREPISIAYAVCEEQETKGQEKRKWSERTRENAFPRAAIR